VGHETKTGIFIARNPGSSCRSEVGLLQCLASKSVSHKGGEVQAENSSAVRGTPKCDRQGKLNQAITATEAWGMSSNLLDYPEENRMKSGEAEGHSIERYAD
jgi:hypothetical protein